MYVDMVMDIPANVLSCYIYCEEDESMNSLPDNKFVDWSKLKAFADNKSYVAEKLEFVLGRVEKWWEK